ncbi:sulfurtransferase [Bacillus sp. MUM 13]|uniref:sulfurtransferase n=1 Tax=Bacillus sp. MUM 13 TaxID=1678001 RepID=UPI0032049330
MADAIKLMEQKQARFADCRFKLGDPVFGIGEYNKDHIPGAVYFDLERDLSGGVKKHGGRHPLPDPMAVKDKLEEYGISNSTPIIAYDSGDGQYAARFVHILLYLGHKEVYLLNGGYREWRAKGQPAETAIPVYGKSVYSIHLNHEIAASYEEVKEIAGKAREDVILLDSREERRFLGKEEPIDTKAGRIPGALNEVWTHSLEDGKYLDPDKQKDRFRSYDPNKQIIVYCGSGVTAAANFIALKEAGFKNVKIYTGSYSDWISYEDNPVECGSE